MVKDPRKKNVLKSREQKVNDVFGIQYVYRDELK